MLGAQVSHQIVGHAQAAVGGGQGAHELLDGIDEGGQGGGGSQTLFVAGLDHGGGGHDTAVDDGSGGQGEVLADDGDGHAAAHDGGGHADDGAHHGAPLTAQRGQIHGCTHVEQQEILAQGRNAREAGGGHDVSGIDAGQEQDQEAHHDDEHGRDLGLGEGAHQVADEENQQDHKYCLVLCQLHM